jgi:hypothetical protein
MDAAPPERKRQAFHGLVRIVFALAVAAMLASGIAGGLLRLGIAPADPPEWLGQAAARHGLVMIAGFFGAVIGIERAVALKLRWAFGVPLLCAAAVLATLRGAHGAAGALVLAAAALFTAVNGVIVRREPAWHTALLLVSALAWLAGCVAHASGQPGAAIALWFGFLVSTIAAERLEMTRLMRRRRGVQPALAAILAVLLASAAAAPLGAAAGALYGAALMALAAWLACFDIARRTVRTPGLPRYMALCLLSGYGWLFVSGAAWGAAAWGAPTRDAALHALGLGFVFSMVMGHAPVILPAVARVKVRFGAWFYIPLVALHASLAWRLGGGWVDAGVRAQGAGANALAIVLFALAMAAGAWAWRQRHRNA